MNKSDVRAIYDQIAAAHPDAVRSFTVVIDAATEYTASGIKPNTQTMRHLFSGGPGQRYTANILARTDLFKDKEGVAVSETGLADKLTGLLCLISGTEYRVMAANTTPCGGLIRIALDSVEQVGL